MNLYDHHVVSLTLSPPERLPESGGWVRTLTWIDREGRYHDLALFAEHGPECLLFPEEQAFPEEDRLDLVAASAPVKPPF